APSCAVPSRTGIVSSTSMGSLGAGSVGAIRPRDRCAARARIAPISCERNGLPSTAMSASGSRSSASSENATRSDARSRKNGRSPCATGVMARPALVKPVSFTSSPYSGCRPAGSSGGVTPPIGSIDSRASSSSVTCTPSRWRFASQPAPFTRRLVPSPSRRRPGTDSVSNRRSRRMALSSGAMREFNCSCSLPTALLFSMSAPMVSTRRAKSASLSAASHPFASRPSTCCANALVPLGRRVSAPVDDGLPAELLDALFDQLNRRPVIAEDHHPVRCLVQYLGQFVQLGVRLDALRPLGELARDRAVRGADMLALRQVLERFGERPRGRAQPLAQVDHGELHDALPGRLPFLFLLGRLNEPFTIEAAQEIGGALVQVRLGPGELDL